MQKMLLFFVIIFLTFQNFYAQNNKLVVGYYNWDNTAYPHTAIDFSNLTHLCHAFLWPFSDGSLDQSQLALYPDLIKTAHSKGVKVLVSIGGYDPGRTPGFKAMINSSTAREAFVKNLVSFVKNNNYDGADFDLEYPGSTEKANFITLLNDVRTAFNANNIPLLAAAVYNSPNSGYDVPKLNTVLDWIGIMTYDFTGSWEQAGTPLMHNSALYLTSQQNYAIDKSVNAWISSGMSKSKVCAGMPFYGYLMNAPDMHGTITSTQGAKSLSYTTIANSYLNNSGWEYRFDSSTKTPYLRNTARTQVVTFDDTVSIRMKCDYIKSKALAGTIIWKIAQSYNSSTKQNPLLSTVGQHLLKSSTSSVAENNAVPLQYSLTSYPNPFNPETKIQYTIPAQGNSGLVRVRLNVYDMLGRLVSVLVNEEKPAGIHQVVFNAGSLASGMYFCKIEAGSFVETRKLLFSK